MKYEDIKAKYGNNPIANKDINQFKYKLFSTVFMYGPTWAKRLDIQKILRFFTTISEIIHRRRIFARLRPYAPPRKSCRAAAGSASPAHSSRRRSCK